MLDMDDLSPTALVDFPGPDGRRQRLRLDQPVRWLVAHDAGQVPGLLDEAHRLSRDKGRWCVGWVAYEAATGVNTHLPVKAPPPGTPYAVWAVFDHAAPWVDVDDEASTEATWHVGPWQRDLDDTALSRDIARIHDLIRAGEVYQINLTSPLRAHVSLGATPNASPNPNLLASYFEWLRRSQPHGYGVMLDSRAAGRAPGAVLSVSPELFFDWDPAAPSAPITTRPMKGTAARHDDLAADYAAAEHLRTSAKERAENLMIVDLLRNDLSRVAEVGSVQVPSLFDVQALPTVWQMTSTVTARTRPGLRLSELFAALFPCGSITGAPKRQAMHHIARMEHSPRGVYCGAMGLITPGGRATFNVPIRTVCIDTPPPPAHWTARCGIGSGITIDATAEGEISEWRHKQAFLGRADAPFELLESLRLENGHLHRLDAHLARMQRAGRHFGFDANEASWTQARQALNRCADAHPSGLFKVRMLMRARGQVSVEAHPIASMTEPVNVHLADRPMLQANEFIRFKTTRRAMYDAFAPPAGCFDTLLRNARGELTEFTMGNLALKLDGRWYTPPVDAGLLPGVMRAALLHDGTLVERTLTVTDLNWAEALALTNSVRGWLKVVLDAAAATF